MGMGTDMVVDYGEWRRKQNMRPVGGIKRTYQMNVSNETWTNLMQLALDNNLKYRGKPSVSFLMELIADGTFKLERMRQ